APRYTLLASALGGGDHRHCAGLHSRVGLACSVVALPAPLARRKGTIHQTADYARGQSNTIGDRAAGVRRRHSRIGALERDTAAIHRAAHRAFHPARWLELPSGGWA